MEFPPKKIVLKYKFLNPIITCQSFKNIPCLRDNLTIDINPESVRLATDSDTDTVPAPSGPDGEKVKIFSKQIGTSEYFSSNPLLLICIEGPFIIPSTALEHGAFALRTAMSCLGGESLSWKL